ncbi:MAG TPA: altronate dehydratase family protein [Candidatus Acidoferrum sp.]|nr:altronate dehydratase family protein [Candidatus Acidoferrum sp.]
MNEPGQRSTHSVLKLDPRDNVIVALTPLRAGEVVTHESQTYTLLEDIRPKHKFAAQDFEIGSEIIMYGVLVGKASQQIARGQLLSTANIRHDAAHYARRKTNWQWSAPDVSRWKSRIFLGYRRPDSQVGTRNYWIVLPLVFCENRNLAVMKRALEEELGFARPQSYQQFVRDLAGMVRTGQADNIAAAPFQESPRAAQPSRLFPNVDGIKFLTHEGGCGGTREDSNNLCGLLAGYINHPNVAGATVLSLGCQHAQISILQEQLRLRNPSQQKPVYFFEQQKSASEPALISEAIRKTLIGLVEANKLSREPAPLSALTVGLKCGGSDGFSGISANPAIGHLADIVNTLGGRTILSEFPELCGVEQNLVDRCVSDEVAQRFIQLMGDYAARAKAVRSGFDMNPSPGNIKDGLLTDAMKSAGAAKKGGTSPVTGVLDYPEYAANPGLHLQCTPGSDVECVTAQVGAGANIVLFTTGLGTPTGNPVTPVIKLSTNTELAERMGDIIDFDAGSIIRGSATVEQVGEQILDRVIEIASGGASTKAETLSQDDFIPWKRGVSL